MLAASRPFLTFFFRRIPLVILLVGALLLTGTNHANAATLSGSVSSQDSGLQGYRVTLYASYVGEHPLYFPIGAARTDDSGHFRIHYWLLPTALSHGLQPVLFAIAQKGPVTLASAIGTGSQSPANVVVNERTTVATGNAFAQFIHDGKIEGNTYGMINAVHMAANLADPETGEAGVILSSVPNGTETSTYATFNSLANVVASCVAKSGNCAKLLKAATPQGGPKATTVLEAMANIVKYPSYPGYPVNDADPIYLLSQVDPVYQPALTERPTNWLLFLKFTGGFYSAYENTNLMSGPGNMAFDAKGNVWINDNYVPQSPDHFSCAGRRLIKLHPWGENFSDSPYFGGGLSGVGFGITLDPQGHVWAGNFGFQDLPCDSTPEAATHNSVSEFSSNGRPISGSDGYTQGEISWPQGTISDRQGNIWVANCGSDSVTKIPDGDPDLAFNIPLGKVPAIGDPQIKPFGDAVDLDGNLWVSGAHSSTVSILSPEGKLIATLPGIYNGKTVLTHPVGVAADSKGDIWVANSDYVDVPCPKATNFGPATNPSITLYTRNSRTPYAGSPFTGGGLTMPWGIAVDGNNTVWVFNFGADPVPNPGLVPTGISHFCGIDTGKCPVGMHVGQAISPSTGYRSDSLERITGGEIDASGNIWLANNWKRRVDPIKSPGGNAVVVAIGAAGPLKPPLIGPPIPFNQAASRGGRGVGAMP